MPRSPAVPVWGFPTGYDPNLMGDTCDTCHGTVWLERKLPHHPRWGDIGSAWTCASCTLLPKSDIPLE